MRVGIVASELERQSTGVGRALSGLLGGLAEIECDWRWTLFFQGQPFEHPLWSDPRFSPVFARNDGSPVLWEQLRLPQQMAEVDLDAIYSPNYSLPPRTGIPGVVHLYDLSFECLPGEFSFRERWRRRFLARFAARRAAGVMAAAGVIRSEIMSRYGLEGSRVTVVPIAVDPEFTNQVGSQDRERVRAFGLRKPYVVMLGTILERRRPDLVINSLCRLRAAEPELTLVIVGANRLRDPGQLERWIDAAGVRDAVLTLGYVDEADLAPIYRGARLAVYLSSYEGFGLPPLEALACGTPVVISTAPGLTDLWPDYPFRCDLEPGAVTETARRALMDPAQRSEVLTRAPDVLAGLTWSDVATRFVASIEGILT